MSDAAKAPLPKGLIVKIGFGDFKRGDHIDDAKQIAAIWPSTLRPNVAAWDGAADLKAERDALAKVQKNSAPPKPADAPAQGDAA